MPRYNPAVIEPKWQNYWDVNKTFATPDLPDGEKLYILDYDDFLDNTKSHLKAICNHVDLPFGEKMKEVSDKPLPLSRFTLDNPSAEKWKKNEKAMANILDSAKQFHQEMVEFRTARMDESE